MQRLDLKIQNDLLLARQATTSNQDGPNQTFTLLKVIGKGTYSSVYLANLNTSTEKIIDQNVLNDQNPSEVSSSKSSEGEEVVSQISEVMTGFERFSASDQKGKK